MQQIRTDNIRRDCADMVDSFSGQEFLERVELLLVELDGPGTQTARAPIDQEGRDLPLQSGSCAD